MVVDWKTATLAPIPDEDPIKLRYFDTGVPGLAQQLYTTVLAVHGMSFNASKAFVRELQD